MDLALDTNAYSAWKRGNLKVKQLVREATGLQICATVLGELLSGFRRGSYYEQNLQELQAFLSDSRVRMVVVGATTADRYSRIAKVLREKGRPIPTNDIWIAASSLEHGAELLSFDAHFSNIDGLVWQHLDSSAN